MNELKNEGWELHDHHHVVCDIPFGPVITQYFAIK